MLPGGTFIRQPHPGQVFRFSANLVRDVIKRFFLTYWNSYVYFVTYANLNNWKPGKTTKRQVLDIWIAASLQKTINQVTEHLDNYDMYNAVKIIEEFVVNDLSNWYIRRSRGRSDTAFLSTLYNVLVNISKLIAPMAPFVSEEIFLNLTDGASIHMSDWPKAGRLTLSQAKIISDMKLARAIVEKVHAKRKEKNIPVRQPLSKVEVVSSAVPSASLWQVVADELNVKKVVWKKGQRFSLKLDTEITPELEEEGKTRDLIRKIQSERKKLGVNLDQKIEVAVPWLPESKEQLLLIKSKTLARRLEKGSFKVTAV